MDQTSALAFGDSNTARYTQPTTSGWIRDVLDCPFTVGNDTHDLMELFLPKTVVSAENQGTWSDYYTYASGNPVYGGDHSTGTQAGLYASSFLTDTYTTTSEGDAINLGAAAAYCAYYFRAYSHGIHGYTLYSSAGFGLFYVGYTNSFDPDPLCGRYSYDLVDYPGNYRTVPCCSSSASYSPCPMGWGRISDSDLFSDWGSNGTFPISDLTLLVSTPPQYLGRNDHIFYRRGFTRDSFVLLSPWFLSPVLGFSYYCPLAVLS